MVIHLAAALGFQGKCHLHWGRVLLAHRPVLCQPYCALKHVAAMLWSRARGSGLVITRSLLQHAGIEQTELLMVYEGRWGVRCEHE